MPVAKLQQLREALLQAQVEQAERAALCQAVSCCCSASSKQRS